VLGSVIFGALKISIPALLIAGGIILFAFALPMVIGEDKQKESDSPSPPPSIEIATYPLAVPLMASPHGLVAIVSMEAKLSFRITKLSTGQQESAI
jgi:multiple antibiotic resistance protein